MAKTFPLKRQNNDLSYVLITKSVLKELYGCSYSTLSRWINSLELDQLGKIPSGPCEPFTKDMAIILHSVFIGVQYFRINLQEYRKKVILAGKSFRFDKVFEEIYGGGNLIIALQEIVKNDELKKPQHRYTIELMIEYFKNKQAQDDDYESSTISNEIECGHIGIGNFM